MKKNQRSSVVMKSPVIITYQILPSTRQILSYRITITIRRLNLGRRLHLHLFMLISKIWKFRLRILATETFSQTAASGLFQASTRGRFWIKITRSWSLMEVTTCQTTVLARGSDLYIQGWQTECFMIMSAIWYVKVFRQVRVVCNWWFKRTTHLKSKKFSVNKK